MLLLVGGVIALLSLQILQQIQANIIPIEQFHHNEYRSSHRRWNQEISKSLKRNLHSCSFQITNLIDPYGRTSKRRKSPLSTTQEKHLQNQHHDPSRSGSTHFLVQIFLPSFPEYLAMQQLPTSYTRANWYTPTAASLRGYNYQEWGKQQDSRWEIPSNHPGQNRKNCLNMTEVASSKDGKIYAFYDDFKQIDRGFYLLKTWNGLVHPGGSVMTECGYYQGEEGCENRWNHAEGWTNKCKSELKKMNISWGNLFQWTNVSSVSPLPQPIERSLSKKSLSHFHEQCTDHSDLGIPFAQNLKLYPHWQVNRVEKVVVLSALWDYNYHHFVADSLARFVTIYPFLLNHPDISIFLRGHEIYDSFHAQHVNTNIQQEAVLMRNRVFELLGISLNRTLTGPILAKEVWIPRSTRCAFALSNPIEIRRLRDVLWERVLLNTNVMNLRMMKEVPVGLSQFPKEFLKKTSLYWPSSLDSSVVTAQYEKKGGKYLIILQRYSKSSTDRSWNDSLFASIILSFSRSFPQHVILPLSSKRLFNSLYCLACDLYLYSLADVLVGAHGAGLTNIMFLPSSSLVVEIVGEFKDVNMPVCGYYGPFGAIFGHHHYIYSYSFDKQMNLDSDEAANDASSFYSKIIPEGGDKSVWKDLIVRIANSTGNTDFHRP